MLMPLAMSFHLFMTWIGIGLFGPIKERKNHAENDKLKNAS